MYSSLFACTEGIGSVALYPRLGPWPNVCVNHLKFEATRTYPPRERSRIMRTMLSALTVVVVALALTRLQLPTSLDPWYAKPHAEKRMRAAVYYEHGPANVLHVEDSWPRPVPTSHQVLIKVVAAALNPVDFKYRRNHVPSFILPKPKIPGHDVAGVIAEVGDRVGSRWKVGDRVAAMVPNLLSPWGALAEYVAVGADLLARVDPSTDLKDAASLPLVAATVIQAFALLGDVDLRGRKILIQAGAGGVGSFAVQYAKQHGMQVLTTASAEKANLLIALGADEVIDYRTTSFEDVVLDCDVVLDPMSWAYEERTLQSSVLKPSGHYVSVTSSDWSLHDGKEKTNTPSQALRLVKHKLVNLFKQGAIPKYGQVLVSPNGAQLQLAMDLLGNSSIHAVIDQEFTLDQVVDAFEYLEQGHASGKVVIVVDDEGRDQL